MPITPTGPHRQPYMVAQLLAHSAKWQEVTGTGTPEAALDHIAIYVSEDLANKQPNAAKPPRAISEYALNYTAENLGTRVWSITGEVVLSIEIPIPDTPDTQKMSDRSVYFTNITGQIEEEMRALVATGEPVPGSSHINARVFNIIDGPFEMSDEEWPVDDLTAPGNLPVLAVWGMVYQLEFQG